MQSKMSLFAAALMTGACALALTACDSMDTAWNDVTGDDTPYAGDVQPPPAQSAPAAPATAMAQPMMPAQPVIPVAAQPIPPQQPMASNYQPNLASVPARPMPAEMPSTQQVQTARADLTASNQMATGYLRDPNAPAQPVMAPPAPLPTPADLMAGQSLGLQQTSPGKYALMPLPPETPLGGFHLASSLMFPYGNTAVTLPQYQELRHVASEYSQQPGRVRVISYGDTTNSSDAIQRATTAAAYLVDMGVPANAIRVKVDAAQPSATPIPGTTMSKTDIFLETANAR